MALKIGSEEILNEDEELDQIFKMYQNHASIVSIQEYVSIDTPFEFTNVSVGEVKSLLRNIDSSKATGYDTIPPKLVKAAAWLHGYDYTAYMDYMDLDVFCPQKRPINLISLSCKITWRIGVN